MAWSSRFLDELAEPVYRPVWRLRTERFDDEPYAGDYVISSAWGYGEDEVLIAEEGPSTIGATLSPTTWSSTIGQFTIPLAGSSAAALQFMTRGTIVVLEMGFVGWDPSDFETVAVGRVWDWQGADPEWRIVCDDMLAILRSRLSLNASGLPLFYDLGGQVTLGANYTAGDTTVTVSSTGFTNRENGGQYGFRIEPDSGDDPFYLIATSATSTVFSGVSDAGFVVYDEGTASYISPTVNAASGSTVYDAAYLSGHPLDIVRKLLTSTGVTGRNGIYDVYPAAWGWAIPVQYVDIEDMDAWKTFAVKVSSGAYSWQIMVDEPIDDPGSWLTQLLADAGLFLTVRMGILTCRAGQAHATASTTAYMPELEIVDSDIESCEFVGLFDPQHSVEYAKVRVISATGDTETSDDIQTLPAEAVREYDVSDRVWDNESAIRQEMSNRLYESATRIPEAIRLVLPSLWWAQLAPGDIVPLTTDRLAGRLSSTADGYDGRRILIVQVSADFGANRTTLLALAYPTSDEVFE